MMSEFECKKVPYKNKLAARTALIQHWRKKFFLGSIHYCDQCEAYHLTKRKPSDKKNGTTGGFRFR
jgi:hypothetical protein